MKNATVIILIFFCTLSAWSQDFKASYTKARAHFDQGDYATALELFKPLMVYDQANSYTEYASFFYGISAYRENYKTLAKNTFLRIEQTSASWNQMDEVRYWLGLLYFEQGEYFHAMEKMAQIKQDKGQRGLKESYISTVRDPEILRMLLEDFHDPVVAEHLIRVLLTQGKEESVMEARRLMGTYNLKEDRFEAPKTVLKPVVRRVAVLFPFLAQTLEPTPATKRNQYALDLYLGMKLAADSLTRAGILIDLALYDTERNREKVSEILTRSELRSADVIAGPLFNDEVRPVRDFSSTNRIPMIHPVSNSPEFISGNDFAMLFQPSWATLGRKSADYLASLGIKKPCMVFYEKTTRDSTIAHAFKSRAAELKIPVVLFTEITKDRSEVISSILTTPVKYDKWRNPVEFKLKKDSLGSIFVASDTELVFTKVIAAVDARNDDTIIIGQESWLEKPGMDWVKFESLKITLASPNFYSPFAANFKMFEKDFIDVHRTAPGLYSRIGFEFMMFMGQTMSAAQKSGSYLPIQQGIDFSGFLSQGFQGKGKQDNQIVPFIRFTNGELVRVD